MQVHIGPCQSLALPSLSTGAYGYPVALAAPTALSTVLSFLRQYQLPPQVRLVLCDAPTYEVYATALQRLQATSAP